MALEIERRFLLKNQDWRSLVSHQIYIQQGYLKVEKDCTVRLRIVDNQAWMTVKGFISDTVRHEFEYSVPVADARVMIEKMCPFVLEKTRYYVPFDNVTFEIDEYTGQNAPLIIAELELPAEDSPYPIPTWLAEEITSDGRYSNAYLSHKPYSLWDE